MIVHRREMCEGQCCPGHGMQRQASANALNLDWKHQGRSQGCMMRVPPMNSWTDQLSWSSNGATPRRLNGMYSDRDLFRNITTFCRRVYLSSPTRVCHHVLHLYQLRRRKDKRSLHRHNPRPRLASHRRSDVRCVPSPVRAILLASSGVHALASVFT